MALMQRIEAGSSKLRRMRQQRAERRLDEIVSVGSIAGDYEQTDRRGDLEIERHFQSLFHLVDSEEEKRAVADAFAVWQRCEKAEDETVIGSVGASVDLLRTNNDYWLADGCGPDDTGRAA